MQHLERHARIARDIVPHENVFVAENGDRLEITASGSRLDRRCVPAGKVFIDEAMDMVEHLRLVVDTGIHDMGWTRDQVVQYMRDSHAVDEPTIQSETDRYISGPAQACSYKLGQLEIRELRSRAQKALGSKFDIRKFHDAILAGGSLPLDLLDARISRWIAAQQH